MFVVVLFFCGLVNIASSNNPESNLEGLPVNLYKNAINSAKLIDLVQKFGNDEDYPRFTEKSVQHQGENANNIKGSNLYETMELLQKIYDAEKRLVKENAMNNPRIQVISNPEVLENYRKRIHRRSGNYFDSFEDQTRSYLKEALRSNRLTIHNLRTQRRPRHIRKYNKDSSDIETDNSQPDNDFTRHNAYEANEATKLADEKNEENQINVRDNETPINSNTIQDSKNNDKYTNKNNSNEENIDKNDSSAFNDGIIHDNNYNTTNNNLVSKTKEAQNIVQPFIEKVLNKLHEKSNAMIENGNNIQEKVNTENDKHIYEAIVDDKDINTNEDARMDVGINIREERMIRSDTSAEYSKKDVSSESQISPTEEIQLNEFREKNENKGSIAVPHNFYFKDSGETNGKVIQNTFESHKYRSKESESRENNKDWASKENKNNVATWQHIENDDGKLQNSKQDYSKPKYAEDSDERSNHKDNQPNIRKENEFGRKNDAWNVFYSQKKLKQDKNIPNYNDWNKKNDNWNSKVEGLNKKNNLNKKVEVLEKTDSYNKKNVDWISKVVNLSKQKNYQVKKWEIDTEKEDSFSKKDDTWNKKNSDWNKKDDTWDKKDTDWNKKLDIIDTKEKDWNKKDYIWNKKDDDWNKKDGTWNKKESDWSKKDDTWNKKDIDWSKKDDNWNKKESDWSKKDDTWNKKDIDGSKKDDNWNKKESDWNKKDDTWNKKDDTWNKKIIDWNKKDDTWTKKESDWSKKDETWNKKEKDWSKKDDNNKKEIDWKKDDTWNIKDDTWNKKGTDLNKKDDIWNKKGVDWNKQVKELSDSAKKDTLRDLMREDDTSSVREVISSKNKNTDWGNYNTFNNNKKWGNSYEVKDGDVIKKELPKRNWNSYVAHVVEERPRKQETYSHLVEKVKPFNAFGRTPIPFLKIKKSIYA